MRKFVAKSKEWYHKQSDTTKAFLWITLLLIIGIIIRWNTIMEGISRGFEFFNNK